MSLSNNKAALFGKGSAGTAAAAAPSSTARPTTTTTSTTSSNTSAALAAARAKRIAEAEEYRGKAENYLKTSFLQWKPDYIASAPMFERAADLYKQADDLESACNMMLKAAQSHEGYNALASVAVANTKAAGFMKAMGSGREKRVAELLSAAAEFWGLSGDLQKYGETLARAAKELEDVNTKEAHEQYKKALSILCPDGQPNSPLVTEILRGVFSFLVRKRLLADALLLSKDMVRVFLAAGLDSSAHKVLASVTIIQLAQGDAVQAQQTYLQEHMNVQGYLESRECVLADELTMAFSGTDIDKLDAAKRSPEMNYLDYEVQQLGKTLSLFDAALLEDAPVTSVKGARPPPPSASGKAGGGSSGSGSDKSSLFAKPSAKAAPPAVPSSAGRPSPPPPPPLPAPFSASPARSGARDAAAVSSQDGEGSEAGDLGAALQELDSLSIHSDGEEEGGDAVEQRLRALRSEEERGYGQLSGKFTQASTHPSGEGMLAELSPETEEALEQAMGNPLEPDQAEEEEEELDLS